MKISKFNFYRLRSGVTVVSLITSDGIEGLGQFINFSFKSQKFYFDELLKPKLINIEINPKTIWDELYWYAHGRNGWIQLISAVDIAIHDILSKSEKKPLWKYLNLRSKEKNQMYWSIGHGYKKTIYEMQKKIEIGLKLGFEAFKIRMDWHELRTDINLEKDFKMLKSIKSMMPKKFYLGFDANGGYSVKKAIYQGKRFEDLGGISHFEEPVATNDLFGLREVVKNLKIPISFGEYEKTASRFLEIIKISNPPIIQPDLLNVGGISQTLKVIKLAKKYKKKIMPHSPDIGILCFASLHLCGEYSKLPHEFSPEIYKYQMNKHDKIFNENILPKKGNIILNKEKHGIGLTLNYKELKKQLI